MRCYLDCVLFETLSAYDTSYINTGPMQLHYELRHGRLLDDRLGIGLRLDHPQPSPDDMWTTCKCGHPSPKLKVSTWGYMHLGCEEMRKDRTSNKKPRDSKIQKTYPHLFKVYRVSSVNFE